MATSFESLKGKGDSRKKEVVKKVPFGGRQDFIKDEMSPNENSPVPTMCASSVALENSSTP